MARGGVGLSHAHLKLGAVLTDFVQNAIERLSRAAFALVLVAASAQPYRILNATMISIRTSVTVFEAIKGQSAKTTP
jgi:hypothetical protein